MQLLPSLSSTTSPIAMQAMPIAAAPAGFAALLAGLDAGDADAMPAGRQAIALPGKGLPVAMPPVAVPVAPTAPTAPVAAVTVPGAMAVPTATLAALPVSATEAVLMLPPDAAPVDTGKAPAPVVADAAPVAAEPATPAILAAAVTIGAIASVLPDTPPRNADTPPPTEMPVRAMPAMVPPRFAAIPTRLRRATEEPTQRDAADVPESETPDTPAPPVDAVATPTMPAEPVSMVVVQQRTPDTRTTVTVPDTVASTKAAPNPIVRRQAVPFAASAETAPVENAVRPARTTVADTPSLSVARQVLAEGVSETVATEPSVALPPAMERQTAPSPSPVAAAEQPRIPVAPIDADLVEAADNFVANLPRSTSVAPESTRSPVKRAQPLPETVDASAVPIDVDGTVLVDAAPVRSPVTVANDQPADGSAMPTPITVPSYAEAPVPLRAVAAAAAPVVAAALGDVPEQNRAFPVRPTVTALRTRTPTSPATIAEAAPVRPESSLVSAEPAPAPVASRPRTDTPVARPAPEAPVVSIPVAARAVPLADPVAAVPTEAPQQVAANVGDTTSTSVVPVAAPAPAAKVPPITRIAAPSVTPPRPEAIVADLIADDAAPVTRARREDDVAPLPTATPTLDAPTLRPVAAPAAGQPTLDTRSPAWMEGMIDHIETLQGANGSRGETRIRLSPDALGDVEISIRTADDGSVQVRFNSDNADAGRLLADAQPRLVQLAEARGLKLGGMQVDVGAQQQQPQRQAQEQPGQPRAPRSAMRSPTTTESTQSDNRIA